MSLRPRVLFRILGIDLRCANPQNCWSFGIDPIPNSLDEKAGNLFAVAGTYTHTSSE